MDLIWLAEQLQKILKEKKESLEDLILNGAKDFQEYTYLRGRYNALEDVEQELRVLLERSIQNDERGTGT
jgi:hypothetical protein|tara:strand:+ start:212 stop:421 length:210 start_codon:yes stop_codon:yes gene_type:complete